jgi:hypothetical protein
VYELRARQAAAGEVRPEAALTLDAVTLAALDMFGPLPEHLSLRGIAGGRRRGLLREREQKQHHEKGVQAGIPYIRFDSRAKSEERLRIR